VQVPRFNNNTTSQTSFITWSNLKEALRPKIKNLLQPRFTAVQFYVQIYYDTQQNSVITKIPILLTTGLFLLYLIIYTPVITSFYRSTYHVVITVFCCIIASLTSEFHPTAIIKSWRFLTKAKIKFVSRLRNIVGTLSFIHEMTSVIKFLIIKLKLLGLKIKLSNVLILSKM